MIILNDTIVLYVIIISLLVFVLLFNYFKHGPVVPEKEDFAKSVFDSGIFIFGALAAMTGFLRQNLLIILGGFSIMLLSIYFFHSLHKSTKLSYSSGDKLRNDKDITFVLEKEKEIKKIEEILRKDIEDIYRKSLELGSKEAILNEREKKIIESEKKIFKSTSNEFLNEGAKRLFVKLDALLEKLPDGEIENFAQSEDFKDYKEILGKIKNGTA